MTVLLESIWLQEGSCFFDNGVHAQIQTCCCIASLSFYHLSWKGYDNSIRNSNLVLTFLERYFSVEFLPAWLRVTSRNLLSGSSTQTAFGKIQMERPKSTSQVPMHVLFRYPFNRPSKVWISEGIWTDSAPADMICVLSVFLLLCMPWINPLSAELLPKGSWQSRNEAEQHWQPEARWRDCEMLKVEASFPTYSS